MADQIVVAVFASLIAAAIAWLAKGSIGALLRRIGRRASDPAERELQLAAIADTRDMLLDMLSIVQAMARRDWSAAARAAEVWQGKRYPRADPDLIADGDLVAALTGTVPDAIAHGVTVPRDLADELERVSNVIRRAMTRQERRVMADGAPRRITPEDADRLRAAGDRIRGALARYEGLSGTLRATLERFLYRPGD